VHISRVPIVLALALSFPSGIRAEVRYTVTDLGDVGQHYAEPWSVSNNGQVAGQSFNSLRQSRGFLWSASTGMIDLIPPGAAGTFPTGVAYGVNDLGQAAVPT
jgi:probable HAF family extracellular repeat protein